jgi:hypothetical protein
MPTLNDDPIPLAYSVIVGRCPDPTCDAVHLDLKDDGGAIFAMASLSPQAVKAIANAGGWSLVPKC